MSKKKNEDWIVLDEIAKRDRVKALMQEMRVVERDLIQLRKGDEVLTTAIEDLEEDRMQGIAARDDSAGVSSQLGEGGSSSTGRSTARSGGKNPVSFQAHIASLQLENRTLRRDVHTFQERVTYLAEKQGLGSAQIDEMISQSAAPLAKLEEIKKEISDVRIHEQEEIALHEEKMTNARRFVKDMDVNIENMSAKLTALTNRQTSAEEKRKHIDEKNKVLKNRTKIIKQRILRRK